MKKTIFLAILISCLSAPQAFAIDAKAIYNLRCAGCHGKDGKTAPAPNAKIIADMNQQEIMDASQRFLDTKDPKGLIMVMQSVLKKLNENERSEVAKYIADDL